MDILATMTPEEYRKVRAQLQAEGRWHGGSGTPTQERNANQRAVEYLTRDLRSNW